MDGFVGHAANLGLQHAVGQLRQRREVQISEQDQAGAQMAVLLRLRLFDLDHQVGAPPDFRGSGQDDRAGPDVLLVGEHATSAGGGLDQNLVARFAQRRHAAGHEADAGFVVFYFFGDAYDHRERSWIAWCLRGAG